MRPRSLAVAACSAFLLLVISLLVLTTPAPTIAAPGGVPSGGLAKGHAKDVVLVGFEPGTSKVKKGVAAGSVGATDVEPLSPLAPDTVVMKLPPGQTVEKAIEKLQKQSGVRYAEPDYYVTTAETSNDTYYADGSLWGMHGDALSPYASPFGSGADEAWAAGAVGSKAVYVGIVDEGVQIDHPDLVDNIWTNPFEIAGNGIDDDGNGYVDDIHGWDFNSGDATVYDGTGDDHGTHVAGTIGARGGNGIGVAGVDWKVTLIPVKFLGPSGGSISSAIAAIDYVSDLKTRHGLNIVATNNSWGYLHTAAMGTPSQALADAIDRGGDRGILFIAAAGNDGKLTKTSDSTPSFLPAGYSCSTRADGSARGWDCIISVANIDSGGGLATTSNYGSASVDLGAPGSSIRSTYPGGYADMSGTSMATPHVTGALALCASLDPGLGAGVLRSRLLGSGTQTASLLGKTATGDRLDIGALVRECGVSVPNIVDKLEATALTDVTAAGLVAGGRSEAYHGTIVAGRVINSTPTAGAMVPPGSTVSYVVSLGIEQVTVPNIVGLTETAADSALTGVGLAPGAKTSAYSTTVAKDLIISQAPAAAATVARGSTVNYVVSLGIEQVTVPNIVGLTETAADSALTGVGLAPGAKTSAYSTTVAKDLIISQAPAAAATVAKGSTVSYVVSLGIEQVTVPNIVGLTETAADSALTGVGLAPGAKTTAWSTTVAKDYIISQAPAAAATVAQGFDRQLRGEPGHRAGHGAQHRGPHRDRRRLGPHGRGAWPPGCQDDRLEHHGRQGRGHQPGSRRDHGRGPQLDRRLHREPGPLVHRARARRPDRGPGRQPPERRQPPGCQDDRLEHHGRQGLIISQAPAATATVAGFDRQLRGEPGHRAGHGAQHRGPHRDRRRLGPHGRGPGPRCQDQRLQHHGRPRPGLRSATHCGPAGSARLGGQLLG